MSGVSQFHPLKFAMLVHRGEAELQRLRKGSSACCSAAPLWSRCGSVTSASICSSSTLHLLTLADTPAIATQLVSSTHPTTAPLQAPICLHMNIIDSLFGRTKSPAERLRQHQRTLQKAQRELDRERTKLEQQEKKLTQDIKKSARAGQMPACKVMAKDLVRTRRHIHKFYQMKTQLQAVSLRIQTLRSNQQMAEAMKGATRAMGTMNRSMNLPAIQRIMRDFERESATMDMKDEMMGEAVDEAMDDEDEGVGEEEESDNILKEVLDEIGVSVGQQLGEAPTAALSAPQAAPQQRIAIGEGAAGGGGIGGGASKDEDALQARLDNLRRD
ncbi:hypothetical protein L1887_51571 [Cichorium endivia]|nr:hypothetical protein L1887_51571 [Cichorium endivia]